MTRAGFPHSETAGSKVVRHLPGPFAADSVLPRPLAPGHPPCALSSLRSRLRSSSTEPATFGTLLDVFPMRLSRFTTRHADAAGSDRPRPDPSGTKRGDELIPFGRSSCVPSAVVTRSGTPNPSSSAKGYYIAGHPLVNAS